MGYNLTIDQGNSTAKAALHLGDTVVETRRIEGDIKDGIAAFVSGHAIDRAIYSSVACDGDDIIAALSASGVNCVKFTPSTPLPVTIGYTTPETLGRDRVAAVVGAMSHVRGDWTLVVDAGSAVTYDLLSPDRCFVGGNIAPGVTMRLTALHEHTRRLPHVSLQGDMPLWGNDTASAMRSGAVYGVVGEIEHYRRLLPPGATVVLTGGDAQLLAPLLPDGSTIVDINLVNRGLNSILQYNENR